jgi:MFS family permease
VMPADQARGNTNPFAWRFVTPLLAGSALNPINSSLIATALVPIAAALHVPVAQTAVLVSALYVATAIAQPTAGKMAEEFGPRRVFLAGILTVLAGGVVGGVGSDLTTLVAARVLIGVGTSTAYPSAMLLIRHRAEKASLDAPPGTVLGALVVAAMVTAAAGLPLGGLLVDTWGWRATFLTNIPLAVSTLLAAVAWIPPDPPIDGPLTLRHVATRIDVLGIVGFGAALTALLVFLLSLPDPCWTALGVAVLASAALVWWELRARHPFFDLRLLATHRTLTLTYTRFAVTTMCTYAVLYGLTLWLQASRSLSAGQSGLLLLPMTGLAIVLVPPISRRNLIRMPLIAAAISCLAGSLGMLFLTTTTPIAGIITIALVFGITLATNSIGNQTALYTQVNADQLGTAAGLLRSFGYLGSIAATATISMSFHTHVNDHGLHTLSWTMITASTIGLIVLLTDPTSLRNPPSRSTPP